MRSSSNSEPRQISGRQRVLEAAVVLFSRSPYSEVGVRDLAARAGVGRRGCRIR
ncbi:MULTISPECIES: TetR family transcriptional regulator [Rhodobacterales]|uniref:TetR family transcriptional regulator n=1 Tax=Rhodobacterales TaxID=204455 RepID=UPI000D2FFEAE|nr:MAG: TetR family transcriptional regulator [Sphingomonadales bacterium]